jgi:hypothetical protein
MQILLQHIKRILGIDGEIYGGRTEEVMARIARITNRQIHTESPCEEYARLATLSFPSGKGIRQTLD